MLRHWLGNVLLAIVLATSLATAQHTTFARQRLSRMSFQQPLMIQPGQVNAYEFFGQTIGSHDGVQLTQDQPSQRGAIWSDQEMMVPNWEIVMNFFVGSDQHKRLGADGMGLFIVSEDYDTGPVYGFQTTWTGIGILIDQYDNDKKGAHPTVTVVVGDGKTPFDVQSEGRFQALGVCDNVPIRNVHGAELYVRYIGGLLSVTVVGENKNAPRTCVLNREVDLPKRGGYLVGVSAQTGDIADWHIVNSMEVNMLTAIQQPNTYFQQRDNLYNQGFKGANNDQLVRDAFTRSQAHDKVAAQARLDGQLMQQDEYDDDEDLHVQNQQPYQQQQQQQQPNIQQQQQQRQYPPNTPPNPNNQQGGPNYDPNAQAQAQGGAQHHRTVNKFNDVRQRVQQTRQQDQTVQQRMQQQNAQSLHLQRKAEQARRMQEMRQSSNLKEFDPQSIHDRETLDEITFELIKRTDRLDEQHSILDDAIQEVLDQVVDLANHTDTHNHILAEGTKELLDTTLRREDYEEYHRAFLEQFDEMADQIEDLRRWSQSAQNRMDEQTRALEEFLRKEIAQLKAHMQAGAAQARRADSNLQQHTETLRQSIESSSSLGLYILYGLGAIVVIGAALFFWQSRAGRKGRLADDWSKNL